jgi:hypothetical protein
MQPGKEAPLQKGEPNMKYQANVLVTSTNKLLVVVEASTQEEAEELAQDMQEWLGEPKRDERDLNLVALPGNTVGATRWLDWFQMTVVVKTLDGGQVVNIKLSASQVERLAWCLQQITQEQGE